MLCLLENSLQTQNKSHLCGKTLSDGYESRSLMANYCCNNLIPSILVLLFCHVSVNFSINYRVPVMGIRIHMYVGTCKFVQTLVFNKQTNLSPWNLKIACLISL